MSRPAMGVALPLAALTAVLAALLTVPPATADAGTTDTWTCTDRNGSWSDASCWDLGAPPSAGDSVVIDADTPITDVPLITLDDLTYAGGDHAHLDSADGVLGGITVTGSLLWSGGALNMPLTIGPGASADLTAGAPKSVGGDLTIDGTMTLDGIRDADADGGLAIDIPKLGDVGYSTLHVAAGGALISRGDSEITGAACCSDPHPITVRNDGTIAVADGSLGMGAVLLDQAHAVHVVAGASLRVHDAVARLRAGSTYDGAGTLSLDHDTSPSPDPDPDDNQGAVLIDGTVTLAHGFTVGMSDRTALAGTGAFAGSGAVDLDDATVYGAVRTGAHVVLAVTGATASHIGTWTDQPGYVGRLSIGGPATVRSGSELDVDAGGILTVAGGGRLSVPVGASLRSAGGYVMKAHSALRVGLRGASLGSVVLDGTARLAGTIQTVGSGPHPRGRHLTLIRATALTGRFGCARTQGWLPAYSATLVRLTGLGTSTPAECGRPVSASTRFRKKVGRRAAHFTVPFGSVDHVLVQITVRSKRSTRVTLRARHGGHITVRARRHRTLHRYAVLRVGSSKRFTVRTHHGKAKVTVRYVSRYR